MHHDLRELFLAVGDATWKFGSVPGSGFLSLPFFFFFYKGVNYFYYLLLTYFNYYYVTSDEMSPTWWNFSHLLPLSPGCGMHSLLHPAFLWHFRYSTSTEFIGFYCGYLFIRIYLRLICYSFEVFTLFIFFFIFSLNRIGHMCPINI